MTNKKVKNAKECVYNNIHFKSKLEQYCYKWFAEHKLPILYESKTYTILPGLNSGVHIYLPVKQRGKKISQLCLKTRKLLPITYTPDFILQLENRCFFIETKGQPNDVYPLKRKMFLRYLTQLEDTNEYWFFEPHNQQQVRETYTIIKNILNGTTHI